MELFRILESLLFATDRPLTAKALSQKLHEAARQSPGMETEPYAKTGGDEVEAGLEQLREFYATSASSLIVTEVAGGFVLKTRPEFSAWTNRLFDAPKAPKLSQPALETLAVIAYRQPIGRAEIESVRGVAVDGVVATLLERKVIRIAGRAELPGRPLLYETTPLFLELFGLKGLDELPNADELRRLQPETPLMPPNNPKSALSSQMAHLRTQVDLIDQKLLQLLQQRTKLSGEIGRTKRRHGAEIYVPDRERELLARVAKLADGKLPPVAAHAIFREILSSSRAAQGQPPIGLLTDSAAQIEPLARCHFGACDQFVVARDWPDMARRLMMGKLAIGLASFDDLAAALQRRWRPGLQVIGEIPSINQSANLGSSIFILKPGQTPAAGNRALILIECKPTADAVKVWLATCLKPRNLSNLRRWRVVGKSCLAALTFDVPVSRDAVAGMGGLIGLYPASESYGG